jgi:two-component system LytT family sensor kinase
MKKSVVVLLHLGYWTLYLMLVLLIILAINANVRPHVVITPFRLIRALVFSPFFAFTIVNAFLGFYSFYFILFPKYFSQKKIAALIFVGLLFAFISAMIPEVVASVFFNPKILFNAGWDSAISISIFVIFLSLIHGIIGLVMRGFITSYGDIHLKEELNKKNYEMELALMKSQINPHFLFNTINNIDVLIQKDAIKASEYLNKLSDIMRFMLYETKTEKITLQKELSYIEKYVELQKIRTTNNNYIKYEVKGNAENLLIEPMLFIPFIENAFKHAENKKVENAIKVAFVIEKDKIKFECENAYSVDTQLKPEHSGLGNEIIQRRLVLLYPNKHTFEVENKNGIYKINLLLSL